MPDDIATAVIAAAKKQLSNWKPWQLRQEEERAGWFLPTREVLRTLVDAVFWASVEREEGRPVIGGVRLSDARPPSCRFGSRDVTAQELRKLSPFFDNGENFLQCSSAPAIVGVGSRGTMDMTVHSERPGVLVVARNSTVFAILEGGGWHLINGDPVQLAKILEVAFGDDSSLVRFRKTSVLVRLAMRARAAQRGAMFILASPNERDGMDDPVYPITSFEAPRSALVGFFELHAQRRDDPAKDLLRTQEISRHNELFLDVTACGSGIDGATWLNKEDFTPIGFGVKVIAQADDREVMCRDLPSDTMRRVRKQALGGMRHQSAARLVQHNNRATVVTVSQDGGVSLFSWDATNEVVVVVKHLDRYLRAPTVEH